MSTQPKSPVISSLVSRMDLVWALLTSGNYLQGLINLSYLHAELKTEDKTSDEGKELLNDILNAVRGIESVVGRHSNHTQALRMNYLGRNHPLYLNLYSRFRGILNDKKYLMEETWIGGIIPTSELKKEKETPDTEKFPERLSEDLG